MEKAYIFETEKNKLTFDTEIESIYLVGEFTVETPGEFEKLEKNAERYKGQFIVKKPKKTVSLSNIEQQGYPFFSGRITLKKTFLLNDENYSIAFDKKGVNAVNVKVNSKVCGSIMWDHLMCDLSFVLCKGENTVELTLVNNLRNMLGPHHLPEGESYYVAPIHFFRRENIWTSNKWALKGEKGWNEDYCFVEFGLYGKEAVFKK